MMRYIFVFAMFIHGFIHLIGFLKAFGYGKLDGFTAEISRFNGLFWLMACLLFVTASVLLLLKNENWLWVALIAGSVSQILIFMFWQDAKFGTIVNLVVACDVIFVVMGKDMSFFLRD